MSYPEFIEDIWVPSSTVSYDYGSRVDAVPNVLHNGMSRKEVICSTDTQLKRLRNMSNMIIVDWFQLIGKGHQHEISTGAFVGLGLPKKDVTTTDLGSENLCE